MALFTPKRLTKKAKAVPYKGKPNPQVAKAMALKEANAKKEMAIKVASSKKETTMRVVKTSDDKAFEESLEKEY